MPMSGCYRRSYFWFLLALGTVLHALTLPYSPPHWQDEVQVNEIGRASLECSDWSMYWVRGLGVQNGTVPYGIWNVGGGCAEVGYRLMGECGPRIVALLALVLSTLLVRLYLRRKTEDEFISDLAALLFFSAPHLVESVRSARMDVIAMLFLFAALVVVQIAGDPRRKGPVFFFVFGVLSACSAFSWATAVLMAPILLFEAVETCRRRDVRFSAALRLFAVAGVGAVLATVVIQMPVIARLEAVVENMVKTVPSAAGVNVAHIGAGDILRTLIGFSFLYLLGIFCLSPRKGILALGGGACLLVCGVNKFYPYRVQYFVPYAIIAIALTLQSFRGRRLGRMLSAAAMCVLLLGYCFSVCARFGLEVFASPYRDYGALAKSLESAIGRNACVYVDAYDVYYIGRGLGWRQYRVDTLELPSDIDPVILPRIDYVVMEEPRLLPAFEEYLSNVGFDKIAEVAGAAEVKGKVVPGILSRIGTLRPLSRHIVFKMRTAVR